MTVRSRIQFPGARTQVGQPSGSPYVKDKSVIWGWRRQNSDREKISISVTKSAYWKVAGIRTFIPWPLPFQQKENVPTDSYSGRHKIKHRCKRTDKQHDAFLQRFQTDDGGCAFFAPPSGRLCCWWKNGQELLTTRRNHDKQKRMSSAHARGAVTEPFSFESLSYTRWHFHLLRQCGQFYRFSRTTDFRFRLFRLSLSLSCARRLRQWKGRQTLRSTIVKGAMILSVIYVRFLTDWWCGQESPPIGWAVRNPTSYIPEWLSSIILAITGSENVYAHPCIYSHACAT